MNYFKKLNHHTTEEMDRRLRELEEAEFELAQLDFDISRTMKQRAELEIVVQQLCELATGHDFENGNNGDETTTCTRCGLETTSYLDYLADTIDNGAKDYHRGL